MGSLAGLNKENGVTVPHSYGRTPNDNLHWDGESIYGCACDEGFTGYDCSRRRAHEVMIPHGAQHC